MSHYWRRDSQRDVGCLGYVVSRTFRATKDVIGGENEILEDAYGECIDLVLSKL